MRKIYAGGPLLGFREAYQDHDVVRQELQLHDGDDNTLPPWHTLEPIMATVSNEDNDEQLIFLPHRYFVFVLAYKTGQTIATLLLEPTKTTKDKNGIRTISCACLARYSRDRPDTSRSTTASDEDDDDDDEVVDDDVSGSSIMRDVVLVGCTDGSIHEFDILHMIRSSSSDKSTEVGPDRVEILGRCLHPQRAFQIGNGTVALRHLEAPDAMNNIDSSDDDGSLLLFAIGEREQDEEKEPKSAATKGDEKMEVEADTYDSVIQSLLRIRLPSSMGTKERGNKMQLLGSDHLQTMESWECCVSARMSGTIFALKSLTVPIRTMTKVDPDDDDDVPMEDSSNRSAGVDVLVVVAKCTGFNIYHERILPSQKDEEEQTRHREMNRGTSSQMIHFPAGANKLTSIAVSPNKNDIACGYKHGNMRILSDVIPSTLDYFMKRKKGNDNPYDAHRHHPSKTVISRKLHWHVHPVHSLVYHAGSEEVEPILYSGAEESVMVIWHLALGTEKPTDTIPRLSKAGIVHLACNSSRSSRRADGGILIYTADNVLQLFETQTNAIRWRIPGLTTIRQEALDAATDTAPQVFPDDSVDAAAPVIFGGLQGAPGSIQSYDPYEQRIVTNLEVAPYNRVSQRDRDDPPLPTPQITHMAFSTEGTDMMTVESVPTENVWVGSKKTIDHGELHEPEIVGSCTAVRFWMRTAAHEREQMAHPSSSSGNSSRPAPGSTRSLDYTEVAAMSFPHGQQNQISAVAVAPSGESACTTSNDEKAFRIWRKAIEVAEDVEDKNNDNEEDRYDKGEAEHHKARQRPVWVCQFKVSSPSGLANMPSPKHGVAFNSDGSTLAIVYGKLITLWDHKQATLLKTLGHEENGLEVIDSVQFVRTRRVKDMILSKSKSTLRLQSPYGNQGQLGWVCQVPSSVGRNTVISKTLLLPNHDLLAVAIYEAQLNETRISFLDIITGKLETDFSSGCILTGKLVDLTCSTKLKTESRWVSIEAEEDNKVLFNQPSPKNIELDEIFVVTERGEAILLKADDSSLRRDEKNMRLREKQQKAITIDDDATSNVPRLHDAVAVFAGGGQKRKRSRSFTLEVAKADAQDPASKRAVEVFEGRQGKGGAATDDATEDMTLPDLTGNFVQAYVGRLLMKATAKRS